MCPSRVSCLIFTGFYHTPKSNNLFRQQLNAFSKTFVEKTLIIMNICMNAQPCSTSCCQRSCMSLLKVCRKSLKRIFVVDTANNGVQKVMLLKASRQKLGGKATTSNEIYFKYGNNINRCYFKGNKCPLVNYIGVSNLFRQHIFTTYYNSF